MVHFVSTLKVFLLLWTLIILSTNADNGSGNLSNIGIISTFLQQFIKPYINSIKVNSAPRAQEEFEVDKAIRLKLVQLRPLLQDNVQEFTRTKNVENEDKLALEGNDETTIIEFMPKNLTKIKQIGNKTKDALRQGKSEPDSFQKNINKYKQLRRNIIKMLDKEKTANETKTLITKTLDEMIAQLIESQCTWKNAGPTDLHSQVLGANKETRRSLNKLNKLSKQGWKNLRKQYMNFLNFRNGQENSFMQQFHEFFKNVMNETVNLATRYKVRCQLVKVGEDNAKPHLRQHKNTENDQCDTFKVCTEELKSFLTNFYSYLNDTSVSAFKNYAAMYIRDVNVDFGSDINVVVSVIDNMSKSAERRVNKIYRKELEKFTLDKNKDKAANIQHIKNFVNASVERVKKSLKKNVDTELGAMKNKLFATVKDDINVNLKVDLNNLGKLFTERVCSFFVVCNGRFAARRHDRPYYFSPKETDNIYVKVQLTLDEDLKDSIARSGRVLKTWQGQDMTHRFGKNNIKDINTKYNNVSVTRTTVTRTIKNVTIPTEATTVPENITPVFRVMDEIESNKI